MEQFNFVYIGLFSFASIWIIYKITQINPKIIIRTKFINTSSILFILAGLFSLLSLIVNRSLMDYIRSFVMILAIVLYLMLKEGFGDEGYYTNGSFTSYTDVVSYDYSEEKNKFNVFIVLRDVKGKNINEHYNSRLVFEIKDKDNIIKFLKNKLSKKYKRLKK